MAETQVRRPDIGHLADVPKNLGSDAGSHDP
jgi:hypothetical protein